MDTEQFYRLLFAPLEEAYGTLDENTLVAIIGFDAGGPLNFCTFNASSRDLPTTYVSCELAQRVDQVPSELGRYELLATCADEAWVRSTVTDIARMSLEVSFGHGHTLDIRAWVEPSDAIQGVIFERACCVQVAGSSFGVLRCIGVTRPELEHARQRGTPSLLTELHRAGVYPQTIIERPSVV